MTASIRRLPSTMLLAFLVAALSLAGCTSQQPASESQEEQPDAQATEPMESAAQPEVFFTNIEDGGTYQSPVQLQFNVENFDIVPVQDPPVVRDGEGHYHLAVDADCIAGGEIVPPGTPSYIHLGDGSDSLSLQLDPGEHHLCLQVADGEHRVLAGPEASGLTKQITINVESEGGAES